MNIRTFIKKVPLTIKLTYIYGLMGLMLINSPSLMSVVSADQYDIQIQQLQNQNKQTESTLSSLYLQASDYQQAIETLQDQIDQLAQKIASSQNKQTEMQMQIDSLEAELKTQRQSLGYVIKTMYVDGQPSIVEQLASSKNLSDFVDKQTYRQAVSSKIRTLVAKIDNLKSSIVKQKASIDDLIKDQKAQRDQLSTAQIKQSELLTYNLQQQSDYSTQLRSNQIKITSLQAEQARLNAREQASPSSSGNSNHGGYPNSWNNAPMDSILDSWGMYNRECVSYTAFKVHQDYLAGKNSHDMPYWGGHGNANQWPTNARANNIPVDRTPTVGAIAVSMAGFYGHTMYVEKIGTINGKPAIYVSQYNANWDGRYSEGWVYSSGLYFIHF